MKIGIIGGGSIGLLFTAYLTQCNHQVELLVKRKQQQTDILNKGLLLQSPTTTFQTFPKVRVLETAVQPDVFDLVIVAVKSYHIEQIIPSLLLHAEKAKTVLFVQNGMKHIEVLPLLPVSSIYLGVVEHGALRMSNRTVRHTGIGRTKVAAYNNKDAGIDWKKLAQQSSFEFQHHPDWYEMLNQKLLINAVINPLTALLHVENGELLEKVAWTGLMETLFEEACQVLNIVNRETAWKELVSVCKNTSLNKSSMLRDIEQAQKTEIEAINGYLLNVAEQYNYKIPTQRFVFQAIKGLEERRESRGR